MLKEVLKAYEKTKHTVSSVHQSRNSESLITAPYKAELDSTKTTETEIHGMINCFQKEAEKTKYKYKCRS